ncbi:FAD assembly factor SdhE [Pararhizobium mangrovi]|uniref:FAD assembly factor SdhE n=1 Tax=Pararhizobium mangrovi TaxID=2590452 RepID=A0A506UBY3_9HYPH|nr:succinate dehydrogenase assembly factor 2 [Pararhizobium mangrovi]TPW31922.1 succinate dehydrogenase assembly factor 2 [Pararhizobium mangrovi]
MTGTKRTSADLDVRRRRLLFRAWHRGIREMDLVLGTFADAEIAAMNDAELSEFEELLEVVDADLLSWVTRREPTPAERDTVLFRRIASYKPDFASLRSS